MLSMLSEDKSPPRQKKSKDKLDKTVRHTASPLTNSPNAILEIHNSSDNHLSVSTEECWPVF